MSRMYYASLFLLIIGFLAYDLHQYDLTVFIRSFNETEVLERALRGIPKCSPDDHSQQRALLYTLQAWTRLAHPNHLRYWISRESLIGNSQHHRILPNDRSIDISILAAETPRLLELAKLISSSQYQLRVHPQWSMIKTSNRSTFPSLGIDFVAYNAQFTDRLNNVSINIWPTYDESSNQNLLVEYDTQSSPQSIPEDWVFPLRPCFFSGVKVWCPAESEKLTLSVYGPMWARKASLRCVNGAWL